MYERTFCPLVRFISLVSLSDLAFAISRRANDSQNRRRAQSVCNLSCVIPSNCSKVSQQMWWKAFGVARLAVSMEERSPLFYVCSIERVGDSKWGRGIVAQLWKSHFQQGNAGIPQVSPFLGIFLASFRRPIKILRLIKKKLWYSWKQFVHILCKVSFR